MKPGIGAITREMIPAKDRQAIEDRAKAMGVVVSTDVRGSRYRTYDALVHDGTRKVRLEGTGSITAVLMAALDDWAETYGWTAEELLAVAAQSGLPVSRA